MNEQAAIQKVLADLGTALPAEVGVRTAGGDEAAKPPYVVVRWRSARLPDENGANPFADVTRDGSGEADGREFHQYFEFTADCVVRVYDEGDRDVYLDLIDEAFLPYEYDSSAFHADTAEWRVGGSEPRSNPIVEPDWYEGGKILRFRYVKRVTQGADALTSTTKTISSE